MNLPLSSYPVYACHKKPLITQKSSYVGEERSSFANEIKRIKLYPKLKLTVFILRFLKQEHSTMHTKFKPFCSS
jgi:hypothetical protein